MKIVAYCLVLLLGGCVAVSTNKHVETKLIRTIEYQQEIDHLLAVDKENKLLEEKYLREITIAQDNNDRDAYKFFIVEYIKIPRIPIPEWMKTEPGFYKRKSAAEVMREYRQEN